MLDLTEKQFFDFMKCPVYYDLIHSKQLSIQDPPSMNKLLNKVAQFFFMKLMNGKVPSTDSIKTKWDKLCAANQDYMTSAKCLDGIGQLMRLYRWAQEEELLIADVKTPYKFAIKTNTHGVINFKGEISTIAINSKTNQPYLLIVDFGNRYPSQGSLDKKMKFTLDKFALLKTFNKDLPIKIYHIKNNKDFYTMRADEDYKRLLRSIESVAVCVEQNLIYPRESVFCESCEMLNLCRVWK